MNSKGWMHFAPKLRIRGRSARVWPMLMATVGRIPWIAILRIPMFIPMLLKSAATKSITIAAVWPMIWMRMRKRVL